MCDMYETIFQEKLKDFKVLEGGKISGYCTSSKQVERLLDRLKTLGFAYSVRSSQIKRPPAGAEKRKEKYFFQQLQGNVHIPFFGPPFSVESICTRHCILGPKYYTKREIVIPDHLLDHVIPKRKRSRVPDTKKSDCPAVIYVKRVRVYPEYAIPSASELWETKAKVLRKLRKDMELPQKPVSYLRFYIVASPASEHTHSTESVEAKGGIHPILAKEIQNLVQNGTTSVKAIKLALDQFSDNFFAGTHTPCRNNTTFYPSKKTIYNHVYRALNMSKKTVFDQGTLQNEISTYEISSDEEIEANYHILETSGSFLQKFKTRELIPEASSVHVLETSKRLLEANEYLLDEHLLETSKGLRKAREHVLETSNSYSQQLEANEHLLETSKGLREAREQVLEILNSYSQQLEANEHLLETSKGLREAREHVLEILNSNSQQLKENEHVLETSKGLRKAREDVLETSDSYSQQLKGNEHLLETSKGLHKARKRVLESSKGLHKARECVLETTNSYLQQLKGNEHHLESSKGLHKTRVHVLENSNSYSQQLKANEHVLEISKGLRKVREHVLDSSRSLLKANEHVLETSNSCSQQLKANEHVHETSKGLRRVREHVLEAPKSLLKTNEHVLGTSKGLRKVRVHVLEAPKILLKAKERVRETSNGYSHPLKAREHVLDTSKSLPKVREHVLGTLKSYSQPLKARQHVSEITNNYSQQLEARKLCEQVSNLINKCSSSEALREVLGLLRECVRKLHLANAEVGGHPIVGPSTSKQ